MQASGPFKTNPRIYFQFMGRLIDQSFHLEPSLTHYFLNYILKRNSKALWFTMNIDGLESYFRLNDDPKDEKCQVLVLHGSLRKAICRGCRVVISINEEHIALYKRGYSFPCSNCAGRERARKPVATEPDIQLYLQENRYQGHFMAREKAAGIPQIVLVMGTTLKSQDGLEHVKAWRRKPKTTIIYVDRDPAPRPELSKLMDYHLAMDCDTLIKRVTEMASIDLLAAAASVHEAMIEERTDLFKADILTDLENTVKDSSNAFKSCYSFFARR
jgi:NAD-dependent SIR2 family protein deacetylase